MNDKDRKKRFDINQIAHEVVKGATDTHSIENKSSSNKELDSSMSKALKKGKTRN